jgi:hypothetical protein
MKLDVPSSEHLATQALELAQNFVAPPEGAPYVVFRT